MTTCHRSIRELDPDDWNRLAGGNAFATCPWLVAAETCCQVPVEPRYFTVARQGRLAAAAVGYVVRSPGGIETIDDMLLGRLAGQAHGLGISFLPALVCGPLLGYGWHIGVRDGLDAVAAGQLREEVLDAIEREAAALRLPVAFTLVTDEERDLQVVLAARGYLRSRNAPIAVLDLPFHSFDDYLNHLPQRRRSEFRRQARRSQKAGIVTDVLFDLDPDTETRLQELVDLNARKHNGQSFAFGPGFIRRLRDTVGARPTVFTARRDGNVTGVSVMLVQDDIAFPIVVGVDPARGADDFTYFLLTYDRQIADAIRAGVKRMYFGRGMEDVKLRRGCSFVDSWVYLRPTAARRLPAAVWCRVASAWNRAKMPARVRRATHTRGGG